MTDTRTMPASDNEMDINQPPLSPPVGMPIADYQRLRTSHRESRTRQLRMDKALVVVALPRRGDDDGQLAEAGLAAADGPYGAEAVSARLGLLVLEAER
jgi:hypothetical protein